uniref:Uncharacterized protein n=1 Tax=Babesia bovis TaxID=5865 RepID=S6CAA0_BABBO|nr:conserved hypothetical protein [Babesia bovis]
MSTSRTKGSTNVAKTIYYHSAIGTHRLQPRPLKNILYPYYRQYKPVYRARNPRTPNYYWPDIDKYPWHSHQKRFPKPEDISVTIFSEFCNRDPKIKTLFETLHPLPLHGVNCLVWKPERGRADSLSQESKSSSNSDDDVSDTLIETSGHGTRKCVTKANGHYYITDTNMRNNVCYLIKHVDYKLRPFKAKVTADMYIIGRSGESKHTQITASLLRENISPVGSIRGEWRWSPPYVPEGCNVHEPIPFNSLKVKDTHLYRPELRQFQKTQEETSNADES